MNGEKTETAAAGPRDAVHLRGEVPTRTPNSERTWSAWLANKKQELLAPANAVLELSEMLLNDARDLGHEEFLTDLHKIEAASRHLLAMLNDVLDPAKIEGEG